MKYNLVRDSDGYVTSISRAKFGGEELSDQVVNLIIPKLTKFENGVITYRCRVDIEDGYIVGIGTDLDGTIDLTREEIDGVIVGATKLVDGKFEIDKSKIPAMQNENNSEPTELDQLKADNATMQSALMELSDYVFSIGGTE